MTTPVLVVRNDREYLCHPGEELQTDLGVLTVPDDISPGQAIETHLGETFHVRQLRGPDLFHHFERTGAPMMPRDIGLLIGETGIQTRDRVLDVGTGTGVLAAYLGRLGASVVTFEQNPDFASVARENMALAGVATAVDVRTGDVLDVIDDLDDFDVLTLDTADAPTILEYAPELLVAGGVVGVYSPYIETAREAIEALRSTPLDEIRCKETIQRDMDFDERGTRPSTAGVGHTGYLLFARNP